MINRYMDIPIKYIVECKQYSMKRKVGIEHIQRLFGVKISVNANKGILVTTSQFSKDALTFASNHLWDIELKDYNDIIQWIKNINH